MEWINVSPIESFIENPRQFIDIDDLHIAVWKVGEVYYAFESVCTHSMYLLDDAPVEGDVVICPFHGAEFCMRSGKVLSAPAYEDLRVFRVRAEAGYIQIERPN